MQKVGYDNLVYGTVYDLYKIELNFIRSKINKNRS